MDINLRIPFQHLTEEKRFTFSGAFLCDAFNDVVPFGLERGAEILPTQLGRRGPLTIGNSVCRRASARRRGILGGRRHRRSYSRRARPRHRRLRCAFREAHRRRSRKGVRNLCLHRFHGSLGSELKLDGRLSFARVNGVSRKSWPIHAHPPPAATRNTFSKTFSESACKSATSLIFCTRNRQFASLFSNLAE